MVALRWVCLWSSWCINVCTVQVGITLLACMCDCFDASTCASWQGTHGVCVCGMHGSVQVDVAPSVWSIILCMCASGCTMGLCGQFGTCICPHQHGMVGINVRDMVIKVNQFGDELREAFYICCLWSMPVS